MKKLWYAESVDGFSVGEGNFELFTVKDRELARLITAAPELLQTLRIVYALVHARPEAWIKSALPRIESVIARAEGKK